MTGSISIDEETAATDATIAFEREIGVTKIPVERKLIGNRTFLKFGVGRQSPLYTSALHKVQQNLPMENPFRGALSLDVKPSANFPASLEAAVLLTLLTRSTREVSQDESARGYTVPYIPFQNREDHQLAQPASHIVRGRRGVGKSTLIRRAVDLLRQTPALLAVLDMQTYSTLVGKDLMLEVFHDVCKQLASSAEIRRVPLDSAELYRLADDILQENLSIERAPPAIKRLLSQLTAATGDHAFVFLDDFHVIDQKAQPELLHVLHGAIKGANGWLKVAGLSSLLHIYSQNNRKGLQVPGDAQFISLDLTLENPEAAERHLAAILQGFLSAVGYKTLGVAIPPAAFKRLVWATAGVPRDFLQMFARALEQAQRNKHATVTLSDVNIAIGEFGRQKMDDLQKDARNEADVLLNFLNDIEKFCLDDNKINAFLVQSEASREREFVHALSDLRMVHLIHQSITPDKAGERYEAYIVDYSIFTGFRRRPGVKEMVPAEAQFKAAELRALPKISAGFLR